MKKPKSSGQFGPTLRRIRKSNKTTVRALAEAMGVTSAAVNFWEAGKFSPDFDTLCGIADYFRTSVDKLLNHTTVAPHAENVTAKGDINAPVAGGDINGNVGSVHNEVGSSLSDALATIKSQQDTIAKLVSTLKP